MLIALDPGKHSVYGALFENAQLVRLLKFDVSTFKNGNFVHVDGVTRAVIEKPNINKNTPNWQSVLDVACSGYLIAGMLRVPLTEHEPNAWKGSIKKPIHHGRVLLAMFEQERSLLPDGVQSVVTRAKLQLAKTGVVRGYSHDWHNHLDAIGLGLFALGRVGRAGIKK